MIVKFAHPFTMIIAGPSGCGKTTFVCKMLSNLDNCVNAKIKKIFWCHAERNALPSITKQLSDETEKSLNIEYHYGIPNTFENDLNEPALIILDDLMNEVDNTQISQLFTRGSHHRNISVVLITQNIFHRGSNMRDISLNAKYIVCFKNPRDGSQISFLARQIYPEGSRELVNVYKQCTIKPHSYLLIDLTQNINDLLRFRTDIFDSNGCVCFCSKKTIKLNESNEIVKENNEDIFRSTSLGEPVYSLCPTV